MEITLINQGLSLMLFGMGVVFAFLTLLVVATNTMSYTIQRWFPEKELPVPTPKKISQKSGSVSPLTLEIIQTAIDQHRKRMN